MNNQNKKSKNLTNRDFVKTVMERLLKLNADVGMIHKPKHLRKCKYIPASQFEVDYENRYDEKIEGFLEILDDIELEHINLIIELNSYLKEEEKIQEIIDLEQSIKRIQSKKVITVKEFEEIYNISANSQKGLRSRLKNPIPYLQNQTDNQGKKIRGGKVMYNVEEVEKWMENNYK